MPDSPETKVGVDVVTVPLKPQQYTVPALVRAQLCESVRAILVTPLTPATSVGGHDVHDAGLMPASP